MRAVFIDRDGTIGGDTEATYPPNFVLYDNVLDSIELLKASGFKVIAFTNQPDIAMGKVSQKEFEDELFGFKFNDVCICPHLPSDLCKCRKPGTYMASGNSHHPSAASRQQMSAASYRAGPVSPRTHRAGSEPHRADCTQKPRACPPELPFFLFLWIHNRARHHRRCTGRARRPRFHKSGGSAHPMGGMLMFK